MNVNAWGDKIGLEEDECRNRVELFMETGLADYQRLKAAFAAGDAQQVIRSAHTIKGAAGNMGIMTVHEAAQRIELPAGENKLHAVPGDVDTLKGLFDGIARFVQA
ncbi:MAG: Hpt domain-containing protein [Desulfobacteraceae bacterium]|jgi:HPt (histidine-containing phosphotransfer) domain-containing protein|nr:Hpt domain-containing protein [Desulfobacteraceae bacterium]